MRHRLTILALAACAFGAAAPAAGAAERTGRLLVTLAPSHGAVGHAAAATLLADHGARLSGTRIPHLGVLGVRAAHGTSLTALRRRLRAQPGVARVDVEHYATPRAMPNDPALTTQEPALGAPAGTPVEWWAQREGLFVAWDTPQALDATVAVIDTGIDASHPELAGQITSAVDNDADPAHGAAGVDEIGHGTHVSSLACAAANNGVGIAGAGYGCKLLFYKSDLSDSSVATSIMEATDAGAQAINMSFGTDGSTPAPPVVHDALRYAYDHDVILVAAAADSAIQQQGYPSDVLQPTGSGGDITQGLGLSVTAANFADQRASFAGYGSQISLAAYGAWNVGTTGPKGLLGAFPAGSVGLEQPDPTPPGYPGCGCRASFDGDSRYAYVQGTSMAAPIVAATAAMVRKLNPDLRAADVIQLLKATARRAPGTSWEPNLGWGILDAGAAVNAAKLLDRRAPATRLTLAKPRSTRLALSVVGVDRAPSGVAVSGVASYAVMRSIDGRKAIRVLRTTKRNVRLTLRRGPRYRFWSIATDEAGNREARPKRADVTVQLRR